MAVVQRLNKVKEFQKADISRKDYVTITAPAAQQCSALSVIAMESGITEVPIVIFATFEKANELLRHKDLIVKKPGADDGS